ncbi:hypothetical protein OQK14_001683, partial [Campylobacter upsaliensis]|nr:hypothetical protein [Campylobacter upsaliensis]
VCIFALACSSQAAWVINKSDSQQETQHIDTTISNDIILNNKNTAIYTDRSSPIGNLTIDNGVTIQVNKNNGKGIEINTGNNGTAVNNITNNGHIRTKGTGISINDRSSAETITVGANGSITSAGGNAIYVGNGSRVNHIDIQGATMGSGGIINRGTIGVQTTTQPNGIKVTGSIISGNNRATALTNQGTIHGGINIDNGTLTGGKQGVNGSFYVAIHNNGGTINGGIKVGQGSTLNGGIMNYASGWGAHSTLNGGIEVAGTINGTNIGIQNSFGTINGDVKITETGSMTGNIWNQTTINGKVEIKGTLTGEIRNRNNNSQSMITGGIIVSGGTITNGIKNEGTIQQNIKVENGGKLQGQGIFNQGKVEGNVQIQGSNVTNIQNTGTVTQKIEVTQNSTIQNGITNTNKINGIDITNSTIGGNIVNSG